LFKLRTLAALGLLFGAIAAQAASAPKYSVTDVGTLPGYLSTAGNSIDALGEVAGNCSGSENGTAVPHAFVYRGGKLIDFGALYNPTLQTKAYFTNTKGEVALTYALPINSNEYPVLYQNGQFTALSFPGGGRGSFAGLNDFGQIAGIYNVNGITQAYLIQANGNVITLPTFGVVQGNFGLLQAQGITELGQVYGEVNTGTVSNGYGVYDAVITPAYGPPVNLGGPVFGPLVCNNIGHSVLVNQVVNTPGAIPGTPWPSFLPALYSGKKITNLPPVPDGKTLTGAVYFPTAINDSDTVVGFMSGSITPLPATGATTGYPSEILPFLYVDGKMYDPNTLVPSTTIQIQRLLGVNNLGQILALGVDLVGEGHTLILTRSF
jgi:hypothetical protein